MDGHVPLQLFGVGPLRGLPSRYSFEGIEVVREIFGVAVAHLPTLGQTGLVHLDLLRGGDDSAINLKSKVLVQKGALNRAFEGKNRRAGDSSPLLLYSRGGDVGWRSMEVRLFLNRWSVRT